MKLFFRQNATIGAAEILCRLPLVFTVGYLARTVGTEAFGNWALIVAYQSFLAGIVALGLSSALSRLASVCSSEEAAGYLSYGFRLTATAALAAGLLTYFLRDPLGQLLGIASEARWLLPVAILLTAASAADGLLDAYFKARGAVRRQVAFILSRSGAEVIGVFLVFATPWHSAWPITGLLAAYIGVSVSIKLIIYPWLSRGMATSIASPDAVRRRAFLRYGMPLVPAVLATWFITQGDRIILSQFADKHDLGIYAFAASLSAYLVFLGYAVYPMLLPRASQFFDSADLPSVRLLFRNSQQLFVLIWAAAMTVISVWSSELITWTAGGAFVAGRQVLLVLCLAVGIEQLGGIYQYVFHLVKRPRLILGMNILYALLLAGGLAFSGAVGGISWTPWTVLAITAGFNVLRYRIAQRHVALPIAPSLVPQTVVVLSLAVFLSLVAETAGIFARLSLTALGLLALGTITLVLYRKKRTAVCLMP